MTGKSYYITTLGDWQRHAARFANSHWIALNSAADRGEANSFVGAPLGAPQLETAQTAEGAASSAPTTPKSGADATRILVLIEADEGVHLALDDDLAFEALPHPLAQKPISDAAQSALAPHGVAPGATTFDAAETLARIHPLLKHRVF